MKTNTLFLLIFLACGCKPPKSPKSEAASLTCSLQRVKPLRYSNHFTYSGKLAAESQISLSFTVPGRILHLEAKEGARVKKGQLLAVLDPASLQVAMEKAGILKDQALDDYKRAEQLYQKGDFPEQEYIKARSQLEQAAAEYRAARRQLAETRLYAPDDGLVVCCAITLGSVVTPSSPCIRMIPGRALYAEFIVPAVDLEQVRAGRLYYVNVPDARITLPGSVAIVLPLPDIEKGGYIARLLLPYTGNMQPGMAVEVSTDDQRERCFAVPLTSLTRSANAAEAIYVLRDGLVNCIPVAVLELEADQAIVCSSLQENDLVFAEGRPPIHK